MKSVKILQEFGNKVVRRIFRAETDEGDDRIGQVAQTGSRYAKRILVGSLTALYLEKQIWDNIKMNLMEMNWTEMVLDTLQWLASVATVKNLWIRVYLGRDGRDVLEGKSY
jgi:hypothetical protein